MVLITIFGPFFQLYYMNRGGKDYLRDETRDLHSVFIDTSALFSIPAAVAAVVRMKQHAPYFEIAFLQSLLTMQFLGLLCTSIISFNIADGKKDSDKHKKQLVIVFYVVVDFAFFMGFIGQLRTSKASWTTIEDLVSACRAYGSIRPGFIYFDTHVPHTKPNPLHITLLSNNGVSRLRSHWIIWGMVIAAIAGIFICAFICYFIYSALVAINLFLGVFLKYWGPVPFAIGALVLMVRMEHQRTAMKGITGTEFMDDQWGFGQVMAVFLWAPLLVQALYYGVGEFPSSAYPTVMMVSQLDIVHSFKLKC